MRRRLAAWYARRGGRQSSLLFPALLGLAIFFGFPTVCARQDILSLISGIESATPRWDVYVERSVAGSVQQAELPFADDGGKTAGISGAGIVVPGIGMVTFRDEEAAVASTPDEDRINRADKQGRVLRVAPMAPPKDFAAGTIMQRQSALMKPTLEGGLKMAFGKSKISGKAIRVAEAFHLAVKRDPNAGLPPAVAALVNNAHPDVLATAYAPAKPDYARKSPFEILLKEKAPDAGRFIPPMEPGDYSWVQNPLPPGAFSKQEQRCLAAAVYFEARGESVKGQAAVAQVVLNRVRNPAYPDTICGVVYQNDKWRNGCQFSFACDGVKNRVRNPQHWKIAEDIAMAVTAGKIWLPEVGSSTHYHATYVHPNWAHDMQKMDRIGRHVFYRTYGGGWS